MLPSRQINASSIMHVQNAVSVIRPLLTVALEVWRLFHGSYLPSRRAFCSTEITSKRSASMMVWISWNTWKVWWDRIYNGRNITLFRIWATIKLIPSKILHLRTSNPWKSCELSSLFSTLLKFRNLSSNRLVHFSSDLFGKQAHSLEVLYVWMPMPLMLCLFSV